MEKQIAKEDEQIVRLNKIIEQLELQLENKKKQIQDLHSQSENLKNEYLSQIKDQQSQFEIKLESQRQQYITIMRESLEKQLKDITQKDKSSKLTQSLTTSEISELLDPNLENNNNDYDENECYIQDNNFYSKEIYQWIGDRLKDPSTTSIKYRMLWRHHLFSNSSPPLTSLTGSQKKSNRNEYIDYKPFEIEYFIQQISIHSRIKILHLDLSKFFHTEYEKITLDDGASNYTPKVNRYTIDRLFPCLSKYVQESNILEDLSLFWLHFHNSKGIQDILYLYKESFDKFIESMKINQSIKVWRFKNFHYYESIDELYQWKPSSVVLIQEPYLTYDSANKEKSTIHGLHNLEKVKKLDISFNFHNIHNSTKLKNYFYQSQHITSITIYIRTTVNNANYFRDVNSDIFKLIHSLPNLIRFKLRYFDHTHEPDKAFVLDQLIKIIEKNRIKKLIIIYCRFNFERLSESISKNTSITHFKYIEQGYERKFEKLFKSNIQKLELSPVIQRDFDWYNTLTKVQYEKLRHTEVVEHVEFIKSKILSGSIHIRPEKPWDFQMV